MSELLGAYSFEWKTYWWIASMWGMFTYGIYCGEGNGSWKNAAATFAFSAVWPAMILYGAWLTHCKRT